MKVSKNLADLGPSERQFQTLVAISMNERLCYSIRLCGIARRSDAALVSLTETEGERERKTEETEKSEKREREGVEREALFIMCYGTKSPPVLQEKNI